MRLATAGLMLAAALLPACKDGTGSQSRTPAAVAITAGDAQTGTAGAALAAPVAAQVSDSRGRPLSGQVVGFTVLTGAGSVGASTVTTDAQGLARTTWTLGGTVGEQKLEARLVPTSGTGTALADTARATASPAAPTSVTIVGSATRSDTAGRTVADSLTVVVRDGFGNPVPGVTVTFTPSGGGTVSPATAVTRADGTARTAWTLGTTPGTQSVQASIAGAAPVTFTATVIPRNRLQLVTRVPGIILDVDATRVLWMDSVAPLTPVRLFIRAQASGTDQPVATAPAGSLVDAAYLTPYGVVYATRTQELHSGTVYDWRGGTSTIIGYFSPEGTLRVAGSYALWIENVTLRLRDLAANTTTDVAANVRPYASLTAAGAVAYSTTGTPNAVHLYTASGNATVASSVFPYIHWNPATDGTNVVFLMADPNNGAHQAVVLRTPTATDTLTVTSGLPFSYLPYLVTNGWVAYGDPGGVYRRTATGAAQRLATYRGAPEALAADGTLVFRVLTPDLGWVQYIAAPGGAAEALGPGSDTDRAAFVGGTAYIMAGGSLYRVVP
jgi:hypothetical protein